MEREGRPAVDALDATLAEREKLRLGPQGPAALTAAGLPGTCYFRTTYR